MELVLGRDGRGFFNLKPLIGRNIFQLLHYTGWPMNFERSLALLAESKVNLQVTGGCVTYAVGHKRNLSAPRASANDFRAQRRGVASSSLELELEPMLQGTAIHPQFERLVQRGHRGIDAAVVIEVGEGHTTMHARYGEVRTGVARNICETAAQIVEHAVGLRFVGVQPAARDEHIQPPIIVEIDETAAPPAPRLAQSKQAATGAGLFECPFAIVAEQLKGLAPQARHQNVRQSVTVEIAEIGSHAGDLAVVAVGCASSS